MDTQSSTKPNDNINDLSPHKTNTHNESRFINAKKEHEINEESA